MKILSRNVNGIRAVLQKGFLDRVKTENPDILCLQEVKAFEHQMPTELRFAIQDYDYLWHRSERPGYAGTAIFYKKNLPINKKLNTFQTPSCFNDDGRVTAIQRSDFLLLNIYFPNGGERADGTEMLSYKLDFYKAYQQEVKNQIQAGKKVITTGDFNICHRPIDIARPKENENSIGFLPIERAEMDAMEASGMIDVFRLQNPDLTDKYTWWSYRAGARPRNVGWRLDYFRVSENCRQHLGEMKHYDDILGSDHCPIGLKIQT
ncbi:MAG: exodeoxyribonuclease III [candidate division SR1 bacterium]|nr:MAG: exodeoxyribonuclease III [candidate division SR1 bacterium]